TPRLHDPVHEPAAEQRMEMLGCLRVHARAQPGGQDHGCERLLGHGLGRDGWGARIRTWDRGTKTRCLTTWLRPITVPIIQERVLDGRTGEARTASWSASQATPRHLATPHHSANYTRSGVGRPHGRAR